MPLFLGRHAGDQLGFGTISTKNRQLPSIDARRAIFAGLIDAKHGLGVAAGHARSSRAHARRSFRLRMRINAAPPSDRMAFHPAMEMPRKRNWTSSQRVTGEWMIWF